MRIAVRVHTRTSRPRRTWDGETLELWLHEPPVDGAANEAVQKAVADWLGIPRSSVSLASGHRSRRKLVDVHGVEALPPPSDARQ